MTLTCNCGQSWETTEEELIQAIGEDRIRGLKLGDHVMVRRPIKTFLQGGGCYATVLMDSEEMLAKVKAKEQA